MSEHYGWTGLLIMVLISVVWVPIISLPWALSAAEESRVGRVLSAVTWVVFALSVPIGFLIWAIVNW